MKQIECEECLYSGMPGLAFDDIDKFTDYECPECGHITRVYDKDDCPDVDAL